MIRHIEIENATKIGNLELDFGKCDDEVYNTIVLAGENGCGKTAILETIDEYTVVYVDDRKAGLRESEISVSYRGL